MPPVLFLDANVLIPNALCDLLLRLAEEDQFVPRWSEDILAEVRRNLPGVSSAAVERRIAFMNAAFDGAMVVDYAAVVGRMTNHVKDRHVLAAAVICEADRIVTCNLRDFPVGSCEPYGLEVQHPDDTLLEFWEGDFRLVLRVIGEQAAATGRRGPRLTILDILDYLERAGARRFAARARGTIPELQE